MPPDAVIADAKAYVLDAVQTMYGSYRLPGTYEAEDPGDPMADLEYKSVRVKYLKGAADDDQNNS